MLKQQFDPAPKSSKKAEGDLKLFVRILKKDFERNFMNNSAMRPNFHLDHAELKLNFFGVLGYRYHFLFFFSKFTVIDENHFRFCIQKRESHRTKNKTVSFFMVKKARTVPYQTQKSFRFGF